MEYNCKECAHYHHRCVLDDLETCRFVSRKKRNENRLRIIVTIILLSSVAAAILCSCNRQEEAPAPVYQSAMELLRAQHKNDLTEFDKLIMAISFTESRFKPDAVGKTGDFGCLQITPIYVREANRVSGANFRHEDAFSVDSSLAMFAAIQDYYNPSHDIEQAIYRHNKSPQYRKTVLENLEMIERYEALRGKLIKLHY